MEDEGFLQRRAEERVGTVLRDKWTLDQLLGVGGMAAVYAATHRNGKRGAVKMLHIELSLDQNCRRRFLREGYVANQVDHPGAVSVLDDDVAEDGSVFLVMELLEGLTTGAKAAMHPSGRVDPLEVVRIADHVLDVIAAAHAKGIVHRDLKPENVFLTFDGRVKILDFGIARMRELPGAMRVTRTGAAMGTPAFMPPEQALGNNDQIDGRTDIWAVGATMFSLLTGRFVHEADTVNKQLLAAMTRPAPPIRTLLPELSHAFAQVVDKALAFEQKDRFQDARAMQQALRALAGAQLITGATATPVPGFGVRPAGAPMTASSLARDSLDLQPRRRRVSLLLASIAAGALFMGVIAFFGLRGLEIAPPRPVAGGEAPSPTAEVPVAAPVPKAEEPVIESSTAPSADVPAPDPSAVAAGGPAPASSASGLPAVVTVAPAPPPPSLTGRRPYPPPPPVKSADPLRKW